MSFELLPFASGIIQKQAVNEIIKLNNYTAHYGLTLTPQQAIELAETRTIALRDNGRIEFGGGVIDRIIREFSDSPYLSSQNYAETLHDLIEAFYYYKNETMDLISDKDMIKFMKISFDGVCRGSTDLLAGKELHRLAENLKHRRPADYSEDEQSIEEDEDEQA